MVVGVPGMYLTKSPWVDEVALVKAENQDEFLDKFLELSFITESSDTTFLWYGDGPMREVSERKIPLKIKYKVLPVQNKKYFKLLGSKVGQQEVFIEANLDSPKSRIISKGEFKSYRNNHRYSVVVKGDRDGGGAFVKVLNPGQKISLEDLPDHWFPILIQEFITGDEISVEAFYRNGSLVSWLYSKFIKTTRLYGPSMVREYEVPTSRDFLPGLIELGRRAKLNGFANVTYIRTGKNYRHQIIEFDLRPNTWHHVFHELEIDLFRVWNNPNNIETQLAMGTKLRKYEPYKLFNFFISQDRFVYSLLVILGFKFKKYGGPIDSSFYDSNQRIKHLKLAIKYLVNKNLNLSKLNDRRLFKLIRKLLIQTAISIKKILPSFLKRWIDRSKWKAKIIEYLAR